MRRTVRLIIRCCLAALTLIGVLLSSSAPVVNAAVPPVPRFAPDVPASLALTLLTDGDGAVHADPDQAAYTAGQTVTLTAVPAPGWHFDHWDGDLEFGADWWDAGWDFRIPVTVNVGAYARTDKPVELAVNFTTVLSQLGVSGQFDPRALRVVEVDVNGALLAADVPLQFDAAPGYNAITNAQGTLIFLLAGTTAVQKNRYYHVYFDLATKNLPAQSVTSQVKLTDNVTDQGQASYKIETSSGTYYYHKTGGGFSSLDDKSGKDWIDYNSAIGSAGQFRGIPNLVRPADGGMFHPGTTNTISSIVSQGPLKLTLESATADGKWQVQWAIYPTYATLTVLKVNSLYWFLYEGVPGGLLDMQDIVVRSDGTITDFDDAWCNDTSTSVTLPASCLLPGPDWSSEWAYMGDPNVGAVGRSLFAVHHEDDTKLDAYRRASGTISMTIFGFGRYESSPLLTTVPQTFSIGLVDSVSYSTVSKAVESAYRPVTVTAAVGEKRAADVGSDSTDNPLQVTLQTDRTITAYFERDYYTVTASHTGTGTVTVAPPTDLQGYVYGEGVTITATPAVGWVFAGWSGSLTGNQATTTLPINGNETIVAAFVPASYTLTVTATDPTLTPTTSGYVLVAPQQTGYAHNAQVTLGAYASAGWQFREWQGDLGGTDPHQTLTMVNDAHVTAVFAPLFYTLAAHAEDEAGNLLASPPLLAPAADPAGYAYGELVAVQAAEIPGMRFVGWAGALTSTNQNEMLTVMGSDTITAIYAVNYYAIDVDVID
ncbi:MAG: hypothetical protein KDD78_12570, partial [Caldilineaceae bacterium]|nr:hypothetical protein [Caldilineaceae bacterium]